ncbi:sporulation protein [Cytobacillus sp. S13-E01]|uniref:sporulation membrane protein YtrI n=1 Tax=Cytobacillus sp. S13-E01 TaxID=3031326 RepID=UPI0023D8C390|nr:sporulation membrane protein YtrI [Cytobacillus sp. S13-E01]MDF0727517.1 sporulation protein [Cytobacillus sp. S13-E01]
MRIPPYYQKPGWQRFFAGVTIGALISWFVFLYMYGVLQEKQIHILKEQQAEIKKLTDHNNVLIEDYDKLNEENKSKIKIQDLKVEFIDPKKIDLAGLTKHELQTEVIKDLNHLIAKDIDTVSKNKELIRSTIENKVYEIDDKKYRLQVYTIFFDTTMEISLKIESVK